MGSNKSNEDYYELLGASPNSTMDELKRLYYACARKYHPDKTSQVHNRAELELKFVLIKDAYDVLSDSKKRMEYDQQLNALRHQNEDKLYDLVTLDEMEYKNDYYTYSCRCGDVYTVEMEEIEDEIEDIIVPCDGCSLCIRVGLSK